MIVIDVRNAHEALPTALHKLLEMGVEQDTRNGKVLMFPTPVTTVYRQPLERVVFWPERDCNPFFHFMESLWMLAGRNDVSFLTQFVPRMKDFSDDGEVFHGAYGHRWRRHFQMDQLLVIIERLRENPNDRRQVLSMWDAGADLMEQEGKKDLPCNTHAYFTVNPSTGHVDMMVCNRSNDLILGCYGANAVHFSYLLEFVAQGVERPAGVYRQVSNNLHCYLNQDFEKVKPLPGQRLDHPYATLEMARSEGPYELIKHRELIMFGKPIYEWLSDLNFFLESGQVHGGMDLFFRRVADPIWKAHKIFKNKNNSQRHHEAIACVAQCWDTAWGAACVQWLQRRQQKATTNE